jgi:hypothetical protein
MSPTAVFCTGVFANWADIMQLLLQQPTQQQQFAGPEGVLRAQLKMFKVMRQLFCLWSCLTNCAPSSLPTAVVDLALLLVRVPHCRLLWTGTAAAAPAAAAADHSSSEFVRWTYCKTQATAGFFLHQLSRMMQLEQLSTEVAAQAITLLREPAVAELLLQLLTAHTVMPHQQQQQPSKQQLRADLLQTPAFHQHQDMLQLLPGGQAYLDAMRRVVVAACGSSLLEKQCEHCFSSAYSFCSVLDVSLLHSCKQQQGSSTDGCTSPALSAAAVRMVLELQLLAAAAVQRLPQQHGGNAGNSSHPFLLSLTSNALHRQIRACLQAGSSCQPPEVLQQAGLQLLQALAAPLQQLQRTPCDNVWRATALGAVADIQHGSFNQQLLALAAAAPGKGLFELQRTTIGEAQQQHKMSAKLNLAL